MIVPQANGSAHIAVTSYMAAMRRYQLTSKIAGGGEIWSDSDRHVSGISATAMRFGRPFNTRYPSRPGSSGSLENSAILLP